MSPFDPVAELRAMRPGEQRYISPRRSGTRNGLILTRYPPASPTVHRMPTLAELRASRTNLDQLARSQDVPTRSTDDLERSQDINRTPEPSYRYLGQATATCTSPGCCR